MHTDQQGGAPPSGIADHPDGEDQVLGLRFLNATAKGWPHEPLDKPIRLPERGEEGKRHSTPYREKKDGSTATSLGQRRRPLRLLRPPSSEERALFGGVVIGLE
jgi:hypothetical protein